MTPDQLQQIIDRMTPGPWHNDVADWHIHNDESDDYIAKCDGLNDTSAIIALRNHASALVECAKLLQIVQHRYWTGDPIPLNEIDAALKRLEEIK